MDEYKLKIFANSQLAAFNNLLDNEILQTAAYRSTYEAIENFSNAVQTEINAEKITVEILGNFVQKLEQALKVTPKK